MTTIAAAKRGDTISIACDSQTTFGHRVIEMAEAKIIRRKGKLIAIAGQAAVKDVLTHSDRWANSDDVFDMLNTMKKILKGNGLLENDDGVTTADVHMVIAMNSKMYLVVGSLVPSEIATDIFAIGSGAHFALGAMTVLKTKKIQTSTLVRRAVVAASKCDIYTSGRIIVRSVSVPTG